MFILYQSNNFKILKNIMFNILKKKIIKNNIFLKTIILTYNSNISFILKIFLAKKLGICANFNFILPSKFIWKIYRIILPEIPKIYFFNKNNLVWIIMKLLPKLINLNEFIFVKNYLNKDYNYEKLFNLSYNMAHIYNEYLIYRVDWLKKWENFKFIKEINNNFNEKWQSILWRKLLNYFLKKYNCKWNESNIYYEFLKKINTRYIYLNKLIYKDVFLFNISCIPPIHLNVIYLLSKYINVHYFLINPLYEYWYNKFFFDKKFFVNNNIKFKFYFNNKNNKLNSILLNWGKNFSEYLYLLSKYNFYEYNYFYKFKNNNILKKIKNKILNFNNFYFFNKNKLLNNNNDNLIIRNYYSYFEEIYELKNFLLYLILNNLYKISDIIVLVNDLELYYPYINLIFSDHLYYKYLPFNIMKYNSIYDNEILNIFLNLLDIYNREFTFTEVLFFLKKKVILNKFNIDYDELNIIFNIIKDIGVYSDLNNFFYNYSFNKFSYYSLINGIKRILLGYCINKDFCIWNNIVPYNLLSNNFFYNIIEKISDFLFKIIYWKNELNKKKVFSDWILICKSFLNDFFDNKIINKCIYLNNELWSKLLFHYNFCNLNIKFNINVFKKILLKFININKKNKNFSISHINFCSFFSLRSVSFKVICLIGMNDNIYLKDIFNNDINLITLNTRIGDRDKIYDYKYAFLESLFSSEKKLYISYINFSFIKNIICFPSILLKNLLNFINYKNINFIKFKYKYLNLNYNLNIISNNNFCFFFKKKNFLNFYNKNILISLDIIEVFWSNPIKYFFNNLLNIKYFISDTYISRKELFFSNIKKIYLLRFKIIKFIIKNKNINDIFNYLKYLNLFPINNFGKILWNKEKKFFLFFFKYIKYKILKIKKKFFIYKFHKFIIYGFFNKYKNGLFNWLPKKINLIDALKFWINHLILCFFNNLTDYSYLYGYNEIWLFPPLDKYLAEIYLSKYVYGYINSFMYPIFLLPESSNIWFFYAYNFYNKKKLNNLTNAKKKLFNFFYGNNFYKGEYNNLYIYYFINRYYKNINLDFIIKEIERWLLPLFNNLIIKKYNYKL